MARRGRDGLGTPLGSVSMESSTENVPDPVPGIATLTEPSSARQGTELDVYPNVYTSFSFS